MPIRFRPLVRPDVPVLSAWLGQPHVAAWWREPADLAAVAARYGPCIDGSDPTQVFIAEWSGAAFGLIQRYAISAEPVWQRALSAAKIPVRAVGLDYLIGVERLTGIGLGPAMIAAFVAHTFAALPGIDEVVVAVQQDNYRSWRAVEKAGFARVWSGVLASDDPSDAGPSFVYVHARVAGAPAEPRPLRSSGRDVAATGSAPAVRALRQVRPAQ
jgi:aminoglycoside 6'-N-acetyltransferase